MSSELNDNDEDKGTAEAGPGGGRADSRPGRAWTVSALDIALPADEPRNEVEAAEYTVRTAVATIVTEAQALEVRTHEQAIGATEFLSRIARQKRQSETARKALVKPLQDHVARINATFREAAEPLEEADRMVRSKVLTYQREQERIAREEQARLDAERRERERVAEKARQAQEAAARAEREAAERALVEAEAAAKAGDVAALVAAETAREAEQAARLAEQELAAQPVELPGRCRGAGGRSALGAGVGAHRDALDGDRDQRGPGAARISSRSTRSRSTPR